MKPAQVSLSDLQPAPDNVTLSLTFSLPTSIVSCLIVLEGMDSPRGVHGILVCDCQVSRMGGRHCHLPKRMLPTVETCNHSSTGSILLLNFGSDNRSKWTLGKLSPCWLPSWTLTGT